MLTQKNEKARNSCMAGFTLADKERISSRGGNAFLNLVFAFFDLHIVIKADKRQAPTCVIRSIVSNKCTIGICIFN